MLNTESFDHSGVGTRGSALERHDWEHIDDSCTLHVLIVFNFNILILINLTLINFN